MKVAVIHTVQLKLQLLKQSLRYSPLIQYCEQNLNVMHVHKCKREGKTKTSKLYTNEIPHSRKEPFTSLPPLYIKLLFSVNVYIVWSKLCIT